MRRKRGFEKRYTNFKEDMMSFIKSSGGIWVTLIALAMLAAGSKIALADTTNLVCYVDVHNVEQDDPTNIELNEAQSTVTVHFGKAHYKNPYLEYKAYTIGPLPAKFETNTITFSHQNGTFYSNYVINRLTGSLFDNTTNWKWNCQAAQKKF
jgi:hypothetical protein